MSRARQMDKDNKTSSEEALECSLCCERYDDNKWCPRLLSCGHTFCTCCLEKMLKDGAIACPQDRKMVPAATGVSALPKNFALLDVLLASSHKQSDTTPLQCDTCGGETHPATSCCLECKENMCEVAAQFHTRYKLSRDHRVVSIAELEASPHLAAIPVFCPEHNEPFRYFDKDCGQVICRDCFALKHSGHKCCSLAEASAQSRGELEALSSKANATAAQLKEAEQGVMAVVGDLNRTKMREEAKIHVFFDVFRATMEAREQALVMELNQLHNAKSFTLTEQCDALRSFRACLLSAVDHAEAAVESAGDVQLLVAKSDIATTLLALEKQPPILQPQADSVLEFSIDDERLLGVLTEAGKVTDKPTYANTTSAFGSGIENATPGEEASFIISARDRQGQLRAVGGDLFLVELKSKNGVKVDVRVADKCDGTYVATYVLPLDVKDEVQLSVLFRGTHIQGSPYRVRPRHGGVLWFIGFAKWDQRKQPYHEQWRLMDEVCARLPGAPPGSRAATWQEYVEGRIKGLPRFAFGDVLFSGAGSEGINAEAHSLKGVSSGRPLDGTCSQSNFHSGPRWAMCVAYK